jgi:hypothetical protein
MGIGLQLLQFAVLSLGGSELQKWKNQKTDHYLSMFLNKFKSHKISKPTNMSRIWTAWKPNEPTKARKLEKIMPPWDGLTSQCRTNEVIPIPIMNKPQRT